MDKSSVLFWDVDTQSDFMQPNGKLVVPDADQIIDTVVRIRRFALDNGFSIVASTDWHTAIDPEISDNPDFDTTFPPHCLAGTDGARRVGDPDTTRATAVPNQSLADDELQRLIAQPPFHLVLRKTRFDVFTNPNTRPLLRRIRPRHIIIFGVALDICVNRAVAGMLNQVDARLTVISDAVRGLDPRRIEQTRRTFDENNVYCQPFERIRDRYYESVVV